MKKSRVMYLDTIRRPVACRPVSMRPTSTGYMVTVKITAKGKYAAPYRHGEEIETSPLFIVYLLKNQHCYSVPISDYKIGAKK